MSRIRRYSVIAVAGGMLVTGLLITSLPATAKTAGPKLKVAPKSKLTNGETVAVSGKGFTPGDQVYIVECVVGKTSTTGSGCAITGATGPELINSKGQLASTSFKVVTGQVGTVAGGGICGTTKANAKACAVSVGNAKGTDAVQVTVAFAVPK